MFLMMPQESFIRSITGFLRITGMAGLVRRLRLSSLMAVLEKQALEVANGLGADVVTLALEGDVNVIRDEGLIDDGYIDDYSDDSSPYTSTIVFLVRKGNPKNIEGLG